MTVGTDRWDERPPGGAAEGSTREPPRPEPEPPRGEAGPPDPARHGPVLFFLGCERSGTTFVQETLARHYAVAPGNESQWVLRYWRAAPGGELATPAQQERFVRSVLADWYFANQANYHQVYFDHRRFLQPGPFDYRRFVREVFGHIADVRGTTWVLNKTCVFCEHMPVVDEVFDRPRVVHVVRDGRDVALSLLRIQGWGPRTVYGAARHWSNRVTRLQDHAARHMAGRYLELRYEELIRDPATAFERITRFYGIHDPERHAQLVRSITIKPENSEKWRAAMSAGELAIFERVAGPLLERNGYARATPGPLAPLPAWERATRGAYDAVASRLGLYPLWFRGLRIVNRGIGRFPALQRRFYRTRLFATHFNWNKTLRRRGRLS